MAGQRPLTRRAVAASSCRPPPLSYCPALMIRVIFPLHGNKNAPGRICVRGRRALFDYLYSSMSLVRCS